MAKGQGNVIIAIFSTSSGNGKTITAINTAAALAKEGYSSCLIDFDLQFGDVLNYLKLPNSGPTVFDAQRKLSQHPDTFLVEQYLTEYRYGSIGFSILPPPHRIDEAYRINLSHVEEIVHRLNYFDFIVLDLTASFSALNLLMLDMSTVVNYLGVMNFLPEIKNYKVGYDTLRHFQYDGNKIRLIENRCGSASAIEKKDVERFLGESFYHSLPNDYATVSQSIQSGVPFVLDKADSEIAKSCWLLSGYYTGRSDHARVTHQPVKEKGFFSRIINMFKH